MLFNSFDFICFFPIVCVIYWCIQGRYASALRNVFLLAASYYFYMNWNPKYAILLFGSTAITYLAAIGIEHFKQQSHKKLCLVASLVLNLAVLFTFKYLDFAAQNLASLLQALGVDMAVPQFALVLPVGISFYIFQALGYSIDVYRGDTKAERNPITYALFVSFFPQLVAGPIERSRNLLQQFKERRTFNSDWAISGLKMMVWGYFLKLALAGRCETYANLVFNRVFDHDGYSTLIGSVMFTLQIYGDFAGYTFIAIGAARILGYNLMNNFRRPYFASSISEFWSRWHISLTSWFRDYVYIPLGGNRRGTRRTYINVMLTFLLSGLWHGANWTFVVWGGIHGAMQCVERAIGYHRKAWHGVVKLLHIALTFAIVDIALIFFRANNLTEALEAVKQIFTRNPLDTHCDLLSIYYVAVICTIVFAKELFEECGCERFIGSRYETTLNVLWMTFVLVCISCLGVITTGKFIYFQF